MNGVATRSTAHELGRKRRQAAVAHVVTRLVVYLTAAGTALACAAPFAWGTLAAFARARRLPDRRIRMGGPPTTRHVGALFHATPFGTFVVDTLLVGAIVVVITLALSLPAAYALARLDRRWGARAGTAILLLVLLPSPLLFLSLSRIMATLGLADSYWAVALVCPVITLPVSVWLLMMFMKTVPVDVEEQALVDGHSRAGAFVRVVLPLVLPGVAAVAVLAFTLAAGEFTYTLTLVWSTSRMPVGTGLPTRPWPSDVPLWQSLQAGVVVVAIPIAAAANLVLDRFTKGLARRSVGGVG